MLRTAVLVAAGIALASLHHLYSDVGVSGAGAWAAVTVVGMLLVLLPGIPLPLMRAQSVARRP